MEKWRFFGFLRSATSGLLKVLRRGKNAQAERKHLEEELRQTQMALQQAEEGKSKAEAESRQLEEDVRRMQAALQQAEEGKSKAEAKSKQLEEDVRRMQAALEKAEEGKSKAEAVGEQLKEKKADPKTGAETRRPEPVDRGGKPRDTSRGPREEQTGKPVLQHLKPEIVCLKKERQWIPAVEVPEEILYVKPGVVVIQNALPLTIDESTESCWCLKEARGQVVVKWNGEQTQIALGEKDYLLFKLGSENQNQGRRIKSPSAGSYLMIVPSNWERDEELSGHPLAAPEAVSIAGHQAHFFHLEKDGGRKIAFRTPLGDSISIPSKESRFELVGTRLNDAREDVGPLLGNGPPLIQALDVQEWENIGTIVVGVEGSGKKRWRTQFRPEPSKLEQVLPPQVGDRKGGWYFVRFYDKEDDLIESLDFRFLCNLKDIKIHQLSPVPAEDGHKPVLAEFLYGPGCIVSAADVSTYSIQIEREDDKATVTIPPDPAWDETRWLVGYEDGPQERVALLVERVWWGIGQEAQVPSQWTDQLLTLHCDDFAAISNKALWLRLPTYRWAEKVLVGFEQAKARPYNAKAMEKTVAIPLRDFGDSPELQHAGITPLRIWIYAQAATHTGICCSLIAELCCRKCDFTASAEEELFDHIESSHIDAFFRPLTWEELRKLFPSLPEKIYKCSFCDDFYAESGPLMNPTSTIIDHSNQRHGQVSFRIVQDVDEIREYVSKFKDLPRYQRCLICGQNLDTAKNDKWSHLLIQSHKKALYELR